MVRQNRTLDISKVMTSNEDLGSELPVSGLLARTSVPYSHIRIADSYTMMKRIYGFQIVQPRITNTEKALLNKYRMTTLECTTINQMNIDIALLKKWSTSLNDKVRCDAEEILKIRVKELKFLLSSKYATSANEIFNGYKALDCYLEEITKFYSK